MTSVELALSQLIRELPLPRHAPVIVTSVPSSPSALATRGFNQSELLAKSCARTTGTLCYVPLLKRTNRSTSQTRLTRKARFANVVGQFSLARAIPSLNNTTIIIIDDVITTGATLAACATVLKEAGAKAVWGITVAKD
ncbi:MAG TPA: phosphoribosyltransferase family protein [Patescibacteria group bacterium]